MGGAYSGKASEWSTSSGKSSALIGLVTEPSHLLRKGIRDGTGADGTRGTYASLASGGGVGKPLRSWRRHRDGHDVLSLFDRDKTTRVFGTVRDFFLRSEERRVGKECW